MRTKVYEQRVRTADGTLFLVPENASGPDGSGVRTPSSVPGAAKATLTAVLLGGRIIESNIALEDFGFADAVLLQNDLEMIWAEGIDIAVMNGDTAGTHQDAGVTDATDIRKAWLGWRALAIDQSYTTTHSGAALTGDILLLSRQAMGKYGGRLGEVNSVAHILPYEPYYDLMKDAKFRTIDVFGPGATNAAGQLGSCNGVPIIVTDKLLSNGYNTSGVIPASGATVSAALTVSGENFYFGTYRPMTMIVSPLLYADYDLTVGLVHFRGHMTPAYPIATHRLLDYMINIS
jgi:hypothetical protein